MSRLHGIFVTGTGTSVGKTAVMGALVRILRESGINVGIMKPIATGCHPDKDGTLISEDAEFLQSAAGVRYPPELLCPYRYEDPVAPSVAAEKSGRPILLPDIISSYFVLIGAHDIVLVEGVGGVLVPLFGGHTVTDLIKMLHLPVLIISANELGTINHTLLTIEHLRQKKIDILGIILNQTSPDVDHSQLTNAESIKSIAGEVPMLGCLPYCPSCSVEEAHLGELDKLVREHINLEPIFRFAGKK
jgi:dethiobiotin synthetase